MEPSTMSKSTDRTAPDQTLDELIAEAVAANATPILPPFEECQRLHDSLRPAIGELAAQVRRRQDYLARGTTGWQACERGLLQAQGALIGDLGTGLRSAALHVATLGEAARVLDACIRETR